MARILSTSYVHVHVHTRTVNVCAMLMISYVILKYAPYDWLKCNPRLQKKKIARGPGPAARGQSVHGVYCAYKWGMSQTDDSPSLIGAACLAGRGRWIFFLQTRIAIPQYFSQSYGAYFKHIVHVHVHTRTVNVCAMLTISYVILKYAPYDWLKCNPRLHVVSLFTAPFTARTSEACHRPMTHHRLSA